MGRGNGNLADVGIVDAFGLISDAESGGNKTGPAGCRSRFVPEIPKPRHTCQPSSPCPIRTSSVDLPFRAMSSSSKWTLEIAGFALCPWHRNVGQAMITRITTTCHKDSAGSS